jgi:hypothetical protein
MWMVTYEAGEKFGPAQPKFLFKRHFFGGSTVLHRTYFVAKNGRFLMIQEDLTPGTQINVDGLENFGIAYVVLRIVSNGSSE